MRGHTDRVAPARMTFEDRQLSGVSCGCGMCVECDVCDTRGHWSLRRGKPVCAMLRPKVQRSRRSAAATRRRFIRRVSRALLYCARRRSYMTVFADFAGSRVTRVLKIESWSSFI